MFASSAVQRLDANVTPEAFRDEAVTALPVLEGLELTAVATSRQETADAATQAFGAKSAYGNAADFASSRTGSRMAAGDWPSP